MKISVIGTGKTGGRVAEMLGDRLHQAFDENRPVTPEALKGSDAVIIFVPGDAVPDILDAVLQSGVPAAWGSTGFEWPAGIEEKVQREGIRWITASNFSLGMNVIRHSIKTIADKVDALNEPVFHIHEIHHIHKKDAPSGTALSWQEWLGRSCEITSDREGDVNGIHELSIRTAFEYIQVRHEALDRSIFAEGAIWAAEHLVHNKQLESGIHTFGELFDRLMEA